VFDAKEKVRLTMPGGTCVFRAIVITDYAAS
jgi:hypothetical protein